ncbi:MAG TPA: hypothetical protein RMH85_17195 [Polyangiaceae bacterium LLY-WYZ-15_(1-7)]|nr:hypothetical protein [Polyangiaceae bacterium LLY-WYZ-15_(1-7)]HJL10239.1 hypothetical protein [Polyangiaceae bacterium LLY-WYZ-15_(1-7)]
MSDASRRRRGSTSSDPSRGRGSASSDASRGRGSASSDPSRRRLRGRLVDVAGVALGIVYALPSLAYRYGPDQAMFHYVAREWLHGRLPYRDVFDVKPPGMFALHGLLHGLFGESMVVARVAAIAAVVGTGVLAAMALRRASVARGPGPRGSGPREPGPRLGALRPGDLGVAVLLACGWHFSRFDWYHSAQTELYQSLLLLGGYVASQRRRFVLTGALLSGAALFKLTAGLPGLVVVLLALARIGERHEPGARRRGDEALDEDAGEAAAGDAAGDPATAGDAAAGDGASGDGTAGDASGDGTPRADTSPSDGAAKGRALGAMVLGGLLPVGAFVAYYAAEGALGALGDYARVILHYGSSAKPDLLGRFAAFWVPGGLFVAVFLGGLAAAHQRTGDEASRRGMREATLLFGSCVVAVLAQKKLSFYQWDVVSGFFVLMGTYALRAGRLPATGGLAAGLVVVALSFALPGASYRAWVGRLLTAPETLDEAHVHEEFDYSYPVSRDLAAMVRGRSGGAAEDTTAEDTAAEDTAADDAAADDAAAERGAREDRARVALHVRGYEPTAYVLSGAFSPARTFENHLHSWWIRDSAVVEALREAHYARLEETAPRFFATRPELPIDLEVLPAAGYARVGQAGKFTLWERVRSDAPPPRWPAGWWRAYE